MPQQRLAGPWHRQRHALLRSVTRGRVRAQSGALLPASASRKMLQAGTSAAAAASRGFEQEQIFESLRKMEFYRIDIEALLLSIRLAGLGAAGDVSRDGPGERGAGHRGDTGGRGGLGNAG